MNRIVQWLIATVLCAAAQGHAAAPPDAYLATLEAAAAGRDATAQIELAMRYENAEGVPRDYRKARELYCDAAKRGHAEAQFRLGWAYANGRGEPRDDAIAAALFAMAAQQGHVHAAKMLQYVRAQPDAELPACLRPDPPPVVAAVEDPGPAPDDKLFAAHPPEIVKLVRELAPEYAVDARLVLAMISVESAFNAAAVSPKNAQGLMQLIPETAARFGVKKVFNPADNIRGGLAYLRWLLAFFQGDVPLVVAAYNAGERAVERYRGIPPYAETKAYVRKITAMYDKAIHPYQADVVPPSPMLAGPRKPLR